MNHIYSCARPSLLAALFVTCWLALCVASTDSDGETGMEQPATGEPCANGRERTDWCGCEPPSYGDDC
jgi:hypothetical protein